MPFDQGGGYIWEQMCDEVATRETVVPDDSLQGFQGSDLHIRVDPPVQRSDDVLACRVGDTEFGGHQPRDACGPRIVEVVRDAGPGVGKESVVDK